MSHIYLCFVWHMHQPNYFYAPIGRALLPWTRLHATKDYRDMVDLVRSYPRVRCTFNLTPVLLDQLERIAAGESDEALRLARLAPDELSPEDRAAVLRDFFSVHRERMLEPRARYRDLARRAAEERSGGAPLSRREKRWRSILVTSMPLESWRRVSTWLATPPAPSSRGTW